MGGLTLNVFVAFPFGCVLKLLSKIFLLSIIMFDGCNFGPVSWLSVNGSFLLYFIKKSTVGCLYSLKEHPLYLISSKSLLVLLQLFLCFVYSSYRNSRLKFSVDIPPPNGSNFL